MKSRFVWMLALAIPAAFVWACGGDDAGVDDGGTDGTVGDTGNANDTGTGKDTGTGADPGTGNDSGLANDTGTGSDTGTVNDSGNGSDTGVTDSGGKDGGTTSLGCTKPSDCTNAFCCGTIVFNGGQIPHCDLGDASSTCNATCKSDVQLSCNATETVRGCAAKNDCLDAGAGYTSCCDVPFGDASVEFCWNSTYAGLAGGSCL